MADNVAYTPGSGAQIATDGIDADGSHAQLVKLAISTDGSRTLIPAEATNGLDVDVTRVQGVVHVDDNSGSLTVDGTVVVTSITNPVTVADGGGAISVDDGAGSLTVDGTVTANQGAGAAASGSWPVKISDGTDTVGISTVSATKALKVDVVQQTGGGAQADKSAFVEGTGVVAVAGGVVNDTIGADPAEDQAAALRLNPKRGLHVNIRKLDGTELGISTAPLRVDPTDTTAQTVKLKDSSGTAFSRSNPLPVEIAPSTGTVWRTHNAYSASQTDQTIKTPTSGKKLYIQGIIITPTAAGIVKITDGADASTTYLYFGTTPASCPPIVIIFAQPTPLGAVDNILRYTTGSGATGDIIAWGNEI